jgi:hypothetical protein
MATGPIAGKPAPTLGKHFKCGSWLACDGGGAAKEI